MISKTSEEQIDTSTTPEEMPIVNEKQQNTLAKALQEETTKTTIAPLETIIQKVATPHETKKTQTPIQTEVAIENRRAY